MEGCTANLFLFFLEGLRGGEIFCFGWIENFVHIRALIRIPLNLDRPIMAHIEKIIYVFSRENCNIWDIMEKLDGRNEIIYDVMLGFRKV